MRDLCIFTIGQGKYQGFIPLFLYSISEAYPDVTAIVFTGGEPTEALSQSMELLEGRNVSIVTDEFSDYTLDRKGEERFYSPEMWRFLLFTTERFEKYLSDFDYYYTTDVDFIVCPEPLSLLDQHLVHCKTIGLPYSAHMRHYKPSIVCPRLFATRDFALRVRDEVDTYDALVKTRGKDIFDVTPRHPGERLLYEIVEKSGLAFPPKLDPYSVSREFDMLDPSNCGEGLFCPHHGIHLGFGRKKLDALTEGVYSQLFRRGFYRDYARWVAELRRDDLFTELLALTPCWAARPTYRMMEALDYD